MTERFSYSVRATEAKEKQARTQILSAVPNPLPNHDIRRRSTTEEAPTPNGRGISPTAMAQSRNDSHSTSPTRLSSSRLAENHFLPSVTNFHKESSTTTSWNTSPTAVARPQKSYGDFKHENLKLERQQSAPAKTLFASEWKSFGLFGCLADHTMNECINLMKVC
jgi:hypothetical protein